MQLKNEWIPVELYRHKIKPCLQNNSKDLSSLVLMNRKFYSLFQPERLVEILLNHVAFGNQDAAEKILKTHPELMLVKSWVLDPSKRLFKETSAFMVALWMMDTYMAGMMLKCLPDGERGDHLRNELLVQYKHVTETGVKYTLTNVEYMTKCFDFYPLMTAYKDFHEKFESWTPDERKKHWCEVIGKEQCKLPMHVRHEMCSPDNSFHYKSEFNSENLVRTLGFHNHLNNKIEVWGSNVDGLGVNFALCKSLTPNRRCRSYSELTSEDILQGDRWSLHRLVTERQNNIEQIKSQLEPSIQKPYSCCLVL